MAPMRAVVPILLAAALLAVAGEAAAAPAIYNLGTIGGASSQGWAVNDAGQVAGESQ